MHDVVQGWRASRGTAVRCLNCGFENPPGLRFCGNCARSLQTVPVPAAAQERKHVTVLFADIVGSTHISGSIDPERLQRSMARFFDIAREEIERFGGTVEKFIGDAVMAVFGLPAIHEDDPERAGRGAISLRSRVRSDYQTGELPQIHIGINTGEVVVGVRELAKGEVLVTGETVNIAARLQQHADAGQILIGERTRLRLRDVAQMRQVPSIRVKGKTDELPAWELIEMAPPRARELRATPFVGREEELSLLGSYIRRVQREGRGQILTIIGPAGVGKTRLVREFQTRISDVRILRGRALSYGTGVPFCSLGEAIRDECEILLGDPSETARAKLQRKVEHLGIKDALPALLSLMGLGGEGFGLTREALFKALQTFLQAIGQRSSMLLILEDTHYSEDVTLDFLEQTSEWIREVPLLLLILSRPELLERRSSWMGGKRNAANLFLDPLNEEETRALASGLLHGKTAPQPLIDLVLQRADGNPLFVEEMLQALIDQGVVREADDGFSLQVPIASVAVPDTVQAVIAARVDALPPGEKRTLQSAAVQGKDIWLGALRYVGNGNHVDESVRSLVAKDLLIQKRRSRLLGEDEFTFRHMLIRDVAYTMIPKAQRWPKHARCGEWLRQIAGDRLAEYADFIAHHWLQVVALRQELGLPPDTTARDQAIEYLLVAGDRAASLYANTTALHHYSRALDLAPDPGTQYRILLGRGQVWMLLGQYDTARDDFAVLRNLARDTGEIRWEAVALDHRGVSFRFQDQIVPALEALELGLALSRRVGDPALTGHILNHIGFTYFSDGKYEKAITAHQEARQMLKTAKDTAGLAESLHGLGENLVDLGKLQESIPWLLASIEASELVGNRSLAAENRLILAHSRRFLGDYREAQEQGERSVAILTEIGDVRNLSGALLNTSKVAITLGQYDRALDYTSRGLELARQIQAVRFIVYHLLAIGMLNRDLEDYHGAWQADSEAAGLAVKVGGAWMPLVLASLALDGAALGRIDDAQKNLKKAREALNATEGRVAFLHEVEFAEGRVLLSLGKADDALHVARKLCEMAESTGHLYWRLPAFLQWGEALAALGEQENAREIYTRAADEAERTGRQPALWRALAGRADAERAVERRDQGAQSARRAREIIEGLAAIVSNERLRATFLQSPKVQRVFSLTLV